MDWKGGGGRGSAPGDRDGCGGGDGEVIFRGDTSTSQIKRSFEELASYLTMEMTFPFGAFLMTGTGIIPEEAFSLSAGDEVTITIGSLVLQNRVES